MIYNTMGAKNIKLRRKQKLKHYREFKILIGKHNSRKPGGFNSSPGKTQSKYIIF